MATLTDPTLVPPRSPSLADDLKSRTAEHHKRAERHSVQQAIVRGAIGRADYGRWVREQRHVQAALERALDRAAIADPRVGRVFVPHHRRLDAFARDCAALGAAWPSEPNPATAAFLATIERWAAEEPIALLGPLYVLEGSTNGGQYLAAALRRSPEFADGSGLAALDPHGPRTRELWQGFRASLDALPFTPEERDAIVAAAAETFDAIGRMLDGVAADAPRS